MGTLTADHEAFRGAVADLRAAADRLEAHRDRAARSVDALLATWSGAAAASYAAGWEDWCAGADRVLAGLTAMTRLLQAVDADLETVDLAAGTDLGRLTGRLG
jgi:WXG100 family type VII secretion target